MADSAKGSGEKEAEGLAKSIVGVLGLSDAIVGGLVLYAANRFKEPEQQLFQTTGIQFVDVALLACAAALLGKSLSLLISFFMGIVRICLRKSKQGQDLRADLKAYLVAETAKARADEADPYDLAVRLISQNSSEQAEAIERIRTASMFSLSSGLVAAIYAGELWSINPLLRNTFVALSSLLLISGVLHQLDHANAIADSFLGLRSLRSGHDDSTGRTKGA